MFVIVLCLIQNGDGTIDFREYVIGLSVLCNPANTEQTIQMAFQLFDIDEDGSITEDEFALIIRSSLGLPDLDVSSLFKEIDADKSNKLSYEEFKDFAEKHPEYAKLFTTYLELQRCQLLTEADFTSGEATPTTPSCLFSYETTPVPRNKVCPLGAADITFTSLLYSPRSSGENKAEPSTPKETKGRIQEV
ncbi:hypothetical protein E2320_001247 [Naja naja]|nr:hypothetical protein E2320_001247 [Naja naja]